MDEAGRADKSEPGKDTRYAGPSGTVPAITPPPEVPGHDFPDEPPPETATAAIEVELLDELGRPVVGERVDVKTPDGNIRRGTTNMSGVVRINNIQPGACEITFVNLDESAVDPAGEAPLGGA